MNVLMFTMTMILLIATMTYAKLKSIHVLNISKLQFEHYFEKNRYSFSNGEALLRYDHIHIVPHKSMEAISSISFIFFSFLMLSDSCMRVKKKRSRMSGVVCKDS